MFLEMNTRLQVEHPVTELVTGIDLVEQQFLIADGDGRELRPGQPLRLTGTRSSCGSTPRTRSGSCRAPARSREWQEPSGPGIRVDAGYAAGNTVTPFYDPLLAKLCVHGADRAQALDRARAAVAEFAITGPEDQPAVPRRAAGQRRSSPAARYDTSVVDRLRP